MSKVLIDISMSLDGFVVAPGATPDEPLGIDGEQLHEWAFQGSAEEQALLDRSVAGTGAIIMGRKTYDDSIRWWGSDGPSGKARIPAIIVTHAPPETVPDNGVYQFVSGVEAAVAAAGKTAGTAQVGVGGGASVVRQVIAAGLADSILLHIVPVLFGGGLRLFDDETAIQRKLTLTWSLVGPTATHLRYDVVK
jgi:dihydrofolate reductase